ncbi:NTP pyrophosphohydrolase [Streptomyces polyrhachis]|uniref:NTP pyrophosphohydrolase n=1 Tax=Streptomyces polyrhachis TaxID=1282885 RepID=A0ABW2GC26_9ACTN
MADEKPLVVVDAANVVGSVPDGWWKDRKGAATRLRDSLDPVVEKGVPGHPGPAEVVLVVEGQARGVDSVEGVRVESAPGSGDDHIVSVVAKADPERDRVVVTADRGLRDRIEALGATSVGPSAVRRKS